MKKFYKFIFVLSLVSFLGEATKVQAQSIELSNILDDLNIFASKNQRERVHLHLDKPFYAAGDDIWIKSYVVIGAENKLSALSKILYIDLLNEQDILVEQRIVPLVSGVGIADFQLPDTLNSSLYKLRAYTNWMQNFDSFAFFEQSLPIFPLYEDEYSVFNDFEIVTNRNRKSFISNLQLLSAKNNQPVVDQTIDYFILLFDERTRKGTIKTDSEGKFSLNLGTSEKTYQGQIELVFPNGSQKFIPINQVNPENIVQFFPEGGTLLAGHDNKVAFKSVGSNGMGIDVDGVILDGQGNKIHDFKSLVRGAGSFVFHPKNGEMYFAEVRFSDGSTSKVRLPEVMESGITLSINNLAETNVLVDVLVTPDLISNQEISLILQKEGEVFYAVKRHLNASINQFSVPKEFLPMGVIQVSVLSHDLLPLSERAIFSQNDAFVLPVQGDTKKADFVSREKVVLDIEVGDVMDSLRFAVLSAAIIDLDKMGIGEDELDWNIFTSLLLSPYIRGAIEKPSQYFDESNVFRAQQLDLLLMTQAWSRIDWSKIHIDHADNFKYQPEQSLHIAGKVTTLNGRTPIRDAEVILISTDSSQVVVTTKSGADGRFIFEDLLFKDGITFMVQAHSDRRKENVMIHLDPEPGIPIGTDRVYYQAVENIKLIPSPYATHAIEEFRLFESQGIKSRTNIIEEVVIDFTLARIKEVTKHSSNFNGPGNADYIVTMFELENCINLATCLMGRFPGIRINSDGWPGIQSAQLTTGSSLTSGQENRMLVILDGIEYGAEATISPLTVISPTDVAAIEFLNRPGTLAIYGSKGVFGVLIITTKTGDLMIDNKKEEVFDVKKTLSKGFYTAREFYTPIYESAMARQSPIKDLRSTIHWEPNIVTDEEGKASFEFFTADGPGTYLITIEGIDLQGRIGRKTQIITVME